MTLASNDIPQHNMVAQKSHHTAGIIIIPALLQVGKKQRRTWDELPVAFQLCCKAEMLLHCSTKDRESWWGREDVTARGLHLTAENLRLEGELILVSNGVPIHTTQTISPSTEANQLDCGRLSLFLSARVCVKRQSCDA